MSSFERAEYELRDAIRRSESLFQGLGFSQQEAFVCACAQHKRIDLAQNTIDEMRERNRQILADAELIKREMAANDIDDKEQ